MNNIKIIGGSSNTKLLRDVANILHIPPIDNVFEYFANTEFRPLIPEGIRGKDVYILQTGGYAPKENSEEGKDHLSANDYLMETYILLKTLRRSDVKTINLIVPFFPYSREDKKDNVRGAISARDVADLFETAKVDRVITFDLHSPQIQGFFNIPCDNLITTKIIKDYLYKNLLKNIDGHKEKFVLVAPDEGAMKRIRQFAELFELPFLVLSKDRDYSKKNTVEETVLIGDKKYLKGRTAIIIDDMIDTFGTIDKASIVLKESGAKDLIVCATHGILSGPAIDLINTNTFIKTVLVSDSIPQEFHKKMCDKLLVFSIAPTIGEVIIELTEGNSISQPFT